MNKSTLPAVTLAVGALLLPPGFLVNAVAGNAPGSDPSHLVVTNPDAAAQAMEGYYVGGFGSKKITVRLDKVIGNTIEGYSVVSGNERAFSGSYKALTSGNIEMSLKEPGDDRTDGVFHLQLTAAKPVLAGSWTPNNKSRSTVQLVLQKREFKYDPHVGKYPQASLKALAASDILNMSSDELGVMLNEMYARHGYSFKADDVQQYFDAQDWYMPLSTAVTGGLTDIEKQNESKIKDLIAYNEHHYIRFGR